MFYFVAESRKQASIEIGEYFSRNWSFNSNWKWHWWLVVLKQSIVWSAM